MADRVFWANLYRKVNPSYKVQHMGIISKRNIEMFAKLVEMDVRILARGVLAKLYGPSDVLNVLRNDGCLFTWYIQPRELWDIEELGKLAELDS